MNLRKWIHYEVSNTGSGSLQKKAFAGLAGFLVLMLLFTVLSRSAAGLTVPKVKTKLPKSMMINHEITISGGFSTNRDVVVTVVDNIKVASIHTAVGASVKAGDTLFQLDSADLDEQLEDAKDLLTKAELQKSDMLSRKAVEEQTKQKGNVRAKEDYLEAIAKEDDEIERALQEMNNAKSEIERYESQMTDKQLSETRKKELAVARATEDYQAALAAANMRVLKAFDEMNATNNNLEAKRAAVVAKQEAEAQKKQTQITRATEAYNSAMAAASREINKANVEMDEAKERMDSYVGKGTEADGQTWLSLKNDYKAKKQAYENAMNVLTDSSGSIASAKRAVEDANAVVVSDFKEELDNLTKTAIEKRQAYDDATAEKAAKLVGMQRAIDDAQATVISDGNEQLSTLQNTYKAKKQAYEDAVAGKEKDLTTAKRAVEDSESPAATDHTAELSDIEMKTLKRKVEMLKSLKAGNGKVTAPKSGIVTKLSVNPGEKTIAGAAVILKDASSGFAFKADVPLKDAQYISKGDSGEMSYNGGKDKLENLKIESIYMSSDNSEMYHVTASLPPGIANPGTSGTLKLKKQSRKYELVVPLNALHKEDKTFFVLVVTEKNTVLGTENVVDRVDVMVEEKNETEAAVSGSLSSDQVVVVETDKKLNPGDRVRLVD